jgi:guanylate kinase
MTKSGHHHPNLFVVAAPSGGGKTSLVKALLERDGNVRLSVSHTTREPRPGETDGVHYHFVDEPTFLRLIDEGAFLEHAKVFGSRYGTTRQAVERELEEGFDVLLDIDWQGARQIRQQADACVTVFILPPSLDALRERLRARGQDSEQEIERRMRQARSEISHCNEFDHVLINDDFGLALDDLHGIVRHAQPLRPVSAESLQSLLAELLGTR